MTTKRPVIVPIGPSIAYVQLTRGLYSVIDSEDALWVGDNNWCAKRSPKGASFYAARGVKIPGARKTKVVYLHRIILGLGDGEIGDHRNTVSLDNRRGNLRKATVLQNSFNRNRLLGDNPTGYKGIYKRRSRYAAQIKVDGKKKNLGTRDTPAEAHMLYVAAAAKFHGEFARFA